ncbi:unnamed protein product [Caretta caretta]
MAIEKVCVWGLGVSSRICILASLCNYNYLGKNSLGKQSGLGMTVSADTLRDFDYDALVWNRKFIEGLNRQGVEHLLGKPSALLTCSVRSSPPSQGLQFSAVSHPLYATSVQIRKQLELPTWEFFQCRAVSRGGTRALFTSDLLSSKATAWGLTPVWA